MNHIKITAQKSAAHNLAVFFWSMDENYASYAEQAGIQGIEPLAEAEYQEILNACDKQMAEDLDYIS